MKNISTEELIVPLTVCLCVSLAGSCAIFDSGPPIGDHLPDVLVEDLRSQHRSICKIETPCILFFYNPSCPPCKSVLENLQTYPGCKSGHSSKLYLLVKRDQEDTLAKPLTGDFPILGISRKAWHSVFQISRTPVLLFYETQGQLVGKQVGWRPSAIQRRILDDFFRETYGMGSKGSSGSQHSVSKPFLSKRHAELSPPQERR